MAEAAISGEDEPKWLSQADIKPKVPAVRQPNKKKHEEELETLNVAIRALETNVKSLNLRTDDSVQSELRTIRSEKDATIGRRKKIDTELRDINHAITKQMAELTKVQSNLQYKNEDKINSAIGNLEHQLKMQNFRLSEEKKIVAEIDSLKRSKKALGKYIELKRVIDGMRERQYHMRQERDTLYKSVTSMKLSEDNIRKTAQKGKAKADDLKRDLDELYGKRKALITEHKMQEKEFQMFQKEIRLKQREDFLRRKEEEARTRQEQYLKDMQEYEASREPYEDEKLLCNTLISYLQRYLSNINGLIEPDFSQLSVEPQSSLQEPVKDLEVAGMYLLRKRSEENDMYSLKPKAKKKNSRERKKSANKLLSHTPKTLDQFEQLGLVAPTVVTEVAQSIAQLEDKKKYYDSLPPPNRSLVHIDIVTTLDQCGASDQDGSAGAPSFTESAISESIPSTPEVSLDNQPPRFPKEDSSPLGEHRHRKLSRDSGACELEDQTSCDEQIQVEESQSAADMTLPMVAMVPKEQGAQDTPFVDLIQGKSEGAGFIISSSDFMTDFPMMKPIGQSNCDEDVENDSETLCNSTDNSNEADLDNIEDVEVTQEEITSLSKMQVVSPNMDMTAPSLNIQEHLISEASGLDNTLESS